MCNYVIYIYVALVSVERATERTSNMFDIHLSLAWNNQEIFLSLPIIRLQVGIALPVPASSKEKEQLGSVASHYHYSLSFHSTKLLLATIPVRQAGKIEKIIMNNNNN